MKQRNKMLQYIGAGCILVGVFFAVIAFALGGFHLKGFQTGLPYEEKSYHYSLEKVKTINIKDRYSGIKLIASDSNQIHIATLENEQEYYDVHLSAGGELVIEQKVNKQWYDYIGINIGSVDQTIHMEVPYGFEGEINASSGSGDIDITQLEQISGVAINSKSGDIRVNSLTAQNQVSINTKSGKVKLDNVTSGGDMTVETSSGDIKVTSVNAGGTLSVDTKSGKTELDEGAAKEDFIVRTLSGDTNVSAVQVGNHISIKASSAALFLDKAQANGDITIETKSGDIRFQALNVGNLSLTSSSGAVNGSINDKRENYTINATSKSGRVRVPESAGGSKRLDVTTKSGDINIDFLY